MNAVERLVAINAARDKARAEHPDVVAFIDDWKQAWGGGEAHFYPKGAPIRFGPTMEQADLANKWQAMQKAKWKLTQEKGRKP